MRTVDVYAANFQFGRTRTLALLETIEKLPAPQAALAWRPGPGRAHIGWQIMHVAVTEEIFATERLNPAKTAKHGEWWARFRGGSTPDDNVPTLADLRSVLASARDSLLETLAGYTDDRLAEVPEALKARNLSVRDVLNILGWHEAHHQGQAHITLNLFKAAHGIAG